MSWFKTWRASWKWSLMILYLSHRHVHTHKYTHKTMCLSSSFCSITEFIQTWLEFQLTQFFLFRPIIKHALWVRWGFSGGSDGRISVCNAGDLGLIHGSRRSPREGHRYPLQYSCLESPMDRGTWQATVHGVTRVGHDWATTVLQVQYIPKSVLSLLHCFPHFCSTHSSFKWEDKEKWKLHFFHYFNSVCVCVCVCVCM